ncbi:MAG: methyl-accepting chemotaxis protein [Bacteroidota bacterium]
MLVLGILTIGGIASLQLPPAWAWSCASASLVLAILAVILAVRLCSHLRDSLNHIAKPLAALAEGRLDVTLPPLAAGHEAAAIVTAGHSLLPRLTRAAQTAAMFHAATSAQVIVAAGQIVLANDSARRLLGAATDDAIAALTQWRADGGTGTVTLGGRILAPTCSPIVADDGTALGEAVDLADITDQVSLTHDIETVVLQAAKGDLSHRVSTEGRSGTGRVLADDVNRLLGTIAQVVDDLATQLEGLATGDLTRRINGMYEGVFGRLKGDFNGTAVKLATVVKQIGGTAEHLTHIAGEVSGSSLELSDRGEKHAASLQEAAAALEELTATVRQNATNAQQANVFAVQARETAGASAQVVADAIAAMGRIEDSSTKIGAIVGMIEEIAFQTNLLALNAAVEAARAGDAGKGFAVVAQEVRNLAQRSADASKEIKGLISESGREVTAGAQMVKNAGGALEQITGSIHSVAAIVEEIAAATREQSTGIEQVTTTISEVDEATQQNAALVEESAATAQALEQQAEGLKDQMAFFLLEASQAQGVARHAALVLGTKIDHVVFRQNVLDTIAGKNNLTDDKLPDHHCCRLGKWYDSVQEPVVKNSQWYAALLDPHKRVHESGKTALSCHAAGNAAGRQHAVDALQGASNQVLEILDALAHDIREGH